MKKTLLAIFVICNTSLAQAQTMEAEDKTMEVGVEVPKTEEGVDSSKVVEKKEDNGLKLKDIFTVPKVSGYIIGQYNASFKDGDKSNTFTFRMIRLSLTGRILGDFEWKLQGQVNGNTSKLGDSPRLVDAYVEWQKFKEFRIKGGEFKRPFTFESPMNPIDQGFIGYAQAIQKLSGYSDRTGEHSSNGRDIGVQIQGDLFPDANGRAWFHYQLGVFNGQGINMKDVDNQKDIIGGAWIMPMKGMRIGAFGWVGSYARDGEWTDENGDTQSGVRKVGRHRYAISAEWKDADWQVRGEYIHSVGGAFATTYQQDEDADDATLSSKLGNRADGWYALCVAPIIRQKLRVKARYDCYRQNAEWGSSKTQYDFGFNYLICKYLEVQTDYILNNDRTLSAGKHNYSQVYVQMCVRF